MTRYLIDGIGVRPPHPSWIARTVLNCKPYDQTAPPSDAEIDDALLIVHPGLAAGAQPSDAVDFYETKLPTLLARPFKAVLFVATSEIEGIPGSNHRASEYAKLGVLFTADEDVLRAAVLTAETGTPFPPTAAALDVADTDWNEARENAKKDLFWSALVNELEKKNFAGLDADARCAVLDELSLWPSWGSTRR